MIGADPAMKFIKVELTMFSRFVRFFLLLILMREFSFRTPAGWDTFNKGKILLAKCTGVAHPERPK